ncbi:hypothetical protein E6Q11_02525 [Candidatus Dojkabacteria bacterium]|uniref:Uncharacterized protein n=1 Tax=Candidatus Dojkabacteria bacterium TaxID=2099670 RepID=A0A5C7J955_9BACT|nr:MAG: hypothetical protein E6Q11_02525 [Candidatus Dojkabacteria bacterium]
MPQIKEYRLRADLEGPREFRRASGEDIGFGRAVQGLGEGISQVGEAFQKRAEQDEISDLNAKLSKGQADQTIYQQEILRKAPPGDKTITENFMKQFDEYMAPIGESATTRAGRMYFAQRQAELRSHFFKSTMIGQAHLAGEKAKTDYIGSLNSASTTLVNDPSSFEMVKNNHNMSVDELVKTSGLSSEQALKLKQSGQEALAKSAAQGWINLDPHYAKKAIADGQFDAYFSGPVKAQMLARADQGIRAEEIETERRLRQEQRILEEKREVVRKNFLDKLANNTLTAKDIVGAEGDILAATGGGSQASFLAMLKADVRQKGSTKTDPVTLTSIYEQINLPDGDPKKIYDPSQLDQFFISGKLAKADYMRLRKEVTDPQKREKKNILDVVKKKLTNSNPLTKIKDPIGDQLFQQYQADFQEEYEKQRSEGKTPGDLLNPNSPDYIVNKVPIPVRSGTQVLRDLVRSNRPATGATIPGQTIPAAQKPAGSPRQPGESAADYLKRTGKG